MEDKTFAARTLILVFDNGTVGEKQLTVNKMIKNIKQDATTEQLQAVANKLIILSSKPIVKAIIDEDYNLATSSI